MSVDPQKLARAIFNTRWDKVELSSETKANLPAEFVGFVLWARLFEGEHVFRMEPEGKTPGDDIAGYSSLWEAVKNAKGFPC